MPSGCVKEIKLKVHRESICYKMKATGWGVEIPSCKRDAHEKFHAFKNTQKT